MNAVMAWVTDNSLFFLLAAGAVFTFLWLQRFRKRLNIGVSAAAMVAVLAEIIGVIAVKCFAALENPGDPEPFAKISLFGGVFFMPLTFWLGAKLTKRKISDVFDILAIALIFTMLCARINCLATGCCEGLPIPGTNGLRWPTRELEIVYYIVFILIFAPRVVKGDTKGEVYPLYMLSYGAFRFLVEFMRASYNSVKIVHISHFWALVSFCVGLSICFELRKRARK